MRALQCSSLQSRLRPSESLHIVFTAKPLFPLMILHIFFFPPQVPSSVFAKTDAASSPPGGARRPVSPSVPPHTNDQPGLQIISRFQSAWASGTAGFPALRDESRSKGTPLVSFAACRFHCLASGAIGTGDQLTRQYRRATGNEQQRESDRGWQRLKWAR